jgi:sulfur-oxidizing protein SoxY
MERNAMISDGEWDKKATRRDVLRIAGAVALAGGAAPPLVAPAEATPAEVQAAVASIVGDARINDGKVKLDIPPLVENGNTVPCTVTVESPMTAADHVKAIHVFTEKNPQPYVISVGLGPRAGRASVSTRIRLRDSQTVLAVAEMSDGTFWSGHANVMVTTSACLEDIL